MTTHQQPADTRYQQHDLLTITEAADLLRTPVATLRYWRHLRIGPPSFRIGRRVFYAPPTSTPGSTRRQVLGQSPSDHAR